MKYFSLLLATAAMSSLAVAADNPRMLFQFGNMSVGSLLKSEMGHGCGCSFYYSAASKAKGSLILHWESGESASMFLQGKLHRLTLQKSNIGQASVLGQEQRATLVDDGMTLTISVRSVWACPAQDQSESCEVTEYVGDIKVVADGIETSIPVWGDYGC